jgi:hypothetical protein
MVQETQHKPFLRGSGQAVQFHVRLSGVAALCDGRGDVHHRRSFEIAAKDRTIRSAIMALNSRSLEQENQNWKLLELMQAESADIGISQLARRL